MNPECSKQATIAADLSNRDASYSVESSSESWQRALFEAVVETSQSKALPLICRARSIIERRLAEMVSEEPSYPSEPLDLRNSQIYLGLLLECVGSERGGFLWD
jgi:hypothetical protein